jgi:hypothetical protein
MIRKPVTLRIIIIEDHAHERLFQHAFREIASQQDVVDELAVLAVLRAGREFRGARDIGEFRGRGNAVVELGINVELMPLRVARRSFSMVNLRLKSPSTPNRRPAFASPSIHASSGATCFDSSSQLRPGQSGDRPDSPTEMHRHHGIHSPCRGRR